MGQDLLMQRYLSDNKRYADLVNGFAFAGKQVLAAGDLKEMDSQSGYRFSSSFCGKGTGKRRQRFRDLIRKAAFGVNFAVIGVENQSDVHYLMPLRTMVYDAGEYERQVVSIRKRFHEKEGKVNMCKALTELLMDERSAGREEGCEKTTRNIIRNMLGRGMSDEDIRALAECGQEMIDEVRKER